VDVPVVPAVDVPVVPAVDVPLVPAVVVAVCAKAVETSSRAPTPAPSAAATRRLVMSWRIALLLASTASRRRQTEFVSGASKFQPPRPTADRPAASVPAWVVRLRAIAQSVR